jgi:hypothetical protein
MIEASSRLHGVEQLIDMKQYFPVFRTFSSFQKMRLIIK